MKKSIFLFFAAILCAMSVNAKTIYLNAGGSSLWDQAGAVFTAKVSTTEYPMTKVFGSYYEGTVPDDATKVTFMRNAPAGGNWNQTSQLSIPTDGKNCYNITQWSSGNWSTYPPTFYIAGDFVTPNWSENAAANKMDYADGVYSKSYNDVAASAHQFKITNGTWTNAIGYDKNTCSGTNCTVEDGGGNIKFTPLAEGTVTITYTPTDGKIHITCPEPPAAEFNITYPATQTNYTLVAGPAKAQTGAEVSFTATPAEGYVLNVTYNGNVIAGENNVYTFMMPASDVTIAITAVAATTLYYVDHDNWGNVNAYMWNDSGNNGWPGVAMTSVGTVGDKAYSYYSISFAQGTYTSIIFNNGSGSQTADLTIETAKPYFYDGAWYTWDDLLAKLAAPVVTYDYYVIGTVNSWTLKDANFGMTDDNADGVYEKVVTLADGKNQMKINNGTWGTQAGYDQLDAKYEGVSRGTSGDDNNIIIDITPGKDITVKFDKNANKITLDGLTKIEDYYTVVGVAELFGTAWDRANETNKMAKQGDGSYKLVKENVTLAAIGYEWKIAKNGDWWNDAATGVNPSEGNNTLTITTAGRYNVTFTLAANLESATVETELLEAAVVIPDCYISGNATLTGGEGWQGNEFTMVYDEETETWAYTLAGLQPEKAYELKVVCGGTWYSYADLASVPTGVTEGNDHSIAFKMAAAGDVVVTYNVEDGIDLTGNFAEPVTYDYYLTGTLVGGWSAKQQGIEKDGELYKATFNNLAAGTYEFKITDGQFNTGEDKTHEHTALGAEYEEVGYNEGNIKIVTEKAINLTVIFNAATDKITFEGLTEKVIEYGVTFNVTVPEGTEACYICGEWDWSTFKPMTKVDDTHYTLTIDDATKDHEYKYTFGEAWTYVEKNADGSDVQNRTWTENDVVAAWADPLATNIYLAGSMTDWDNGRIEFMKATPDATIATVAVELPVGDNTFKIMNGDTWLGNGGTVENSITGWTFKEGDGDCTLKATYAATYVFTWDLTKEDQQLSVTYPTVVTRNYPSVTKSLFNGWRTSYTELDLGNYNTITIYNHDGTAFTYGDDFEVTASLEVNLEGTGSWKVDGDNEVLTATLYNEEKTAIYLITASTAAPKTYTLNCTDAQYASTAYGTVFTGTADGKVLMIDVSMMQVGVNEAFGICSWNDIEISSNLATVTKAGDKYSLTGDFTDAAGNTYKVTITDATPKPATELTVTGATFTESAWGNVEITGVWGSEELGATLGSAEFGDQDWGVEIWTESIYLTPIGSVNFAQADDGVSVVLKGQFSDANANPYNVSITGTLVEYVTPVVEFGDGNNTTAMSDYEWQIVDAKIKRSFVAEDGWYTLCVPFGMDASLIGEAYEITSINKNDKTQGIDVTFSEVDYLLAGNPYLIKPTATVTDPVIEGVEIEYTTGESYTVTGDNIKITMTGIINGGGTTNGTTEYYVGADGYLYNGEVDKLGLRALFTITDLAGNATRVRARVVTGENATTGVDDTFTTDVPVKAIENGQLIIIRDGVKYNVQGQKL